jgi:predicted hydrocarbon binding protein
MRDSNADNIVDQVWSTALDKITKPANAAVDRPSLGDQIELAAAQAGTATLLASVPSFNKMLYNSGYAASARNTYLILRRLGMPADFFWKYEQWNSQRALDTLDKIVSKVFTTMLSKQHVGTLKLTSADPLTNRFEVTFDSCAECSGLHSHDPMCFFHAGSFAGMLAAMLDHEFDAWEIECVASGADACRFEIGERADRQAQVSWGRWADNFTYEFAPAARFAASLDGDSIRELGESVDVGYYQMLLASTILTNLEVVERSCLDAGRSLGAKLADTVRDRFGANPLDAIPAFYKHLHYASLTVSENASGFRVVVGEAPEHLGVLESSALVPFLSGELEGMLSALSGRDLDLGTTDIDGHDLILSYAPRS